MKARGKGVGAKPDLRRQAIYVAIAFGAVLAGYGAGLLIKLDPQRPVQLKDSFSQKTHTESERNTGKPVQFENSAPRATDGASHTAIYPDPVPAYAELPIRAYEEALPSEVHEAELKEGIAKDAPGLEEGVVLRLPGAIAEPPESASLPPWRRYAVAFPEAGSRPKVVIVIDDLGMDRKRTARAIGLKGPLTLSFLTYAEDLKEQTAIARVAGHELLLHVGMEPISESVDPGPNVLLTELDSKEIRRLLEWNLGRTEGYVGINNHMGSKFTADPFGMTVVMQTLKHRGLLFLDSRTTGRSVGARLARELGVPVAERNLFLDNVNKNAAVEARLIELEQLARRKGYAIAIGHPRDATLEALEGWLQNLEDRGLALVPLSAVTIADQDENLRSDNTHRLEECAFGHGKSSRGCK